MKKKNCLLNIQLKQIEFSTESELEKIDSERSVRS